MTDSPLPTATVVITTKNRKEELRAAIASALGQDAHPEVLVVDDGSTDGTSVMVAGQFPTVKLLRSEQSQGYIAQRNRAAREVRTPLVVSIDDDALFPSPRTVGQSLECFAEPRVGAVAIPFVNVRQDDRVRQKAPESGGIRVASSFIGTAHVLRRELFLSLGGYREFLFHQGEEEDYCLRMLQRGYVVALGEADPIHHLESPRRDFTRMDVYGRRNNVLFAWYNVPMPFLPMHLLGTTARGIRHGLAKGRLGNMIRGLAAGYAAIGKQWSARQPVPAGVYRLDRWLRQHPGAALREIEDRLVPIGAAQKVG